VETPARRFFIVFLLVSLASVCLECLVGLFWGEWKRETTEISQRAYSVIQIQKNVVNTD